MKKHNQIDIVPGIIIAMILFKFFLFFFFFTKICLLLPGTQVGKTPPRLLGA